MKSVSLEEFESFGEEYARILKEKLSISTVDDFLQHSLVEIQSKSGIEPKRVQQWFQILDLFRVPQLTPREAEILYYINVNSVEELSHRQSFRIYYKLKELDVESYFIIVQFPTLVKIDKWIYYAKLMTKRIKRGLGIPIIKLPLMNIGRALELQKLSIWTVEDFIGKLPVVKDMRKRLNMNKKEYQTFLDIVGLIKIDGIDSYFASVFLRAGISSVAILQSTPETEILNRVKPVQENDPNCPEKLTLALLTEIKQNIRKEA